MQSSAADTVWLALPILFLLIRELATSDLVQWSSAESNKLRPPDETAVAIAATIN